MTKSVFGHLNVLPVENPEDLIFRGRTKSPKIDHLPVEMNEYEHTIWREYMAGNVVRHL